MKSVRVPLIASVVLVIALLLVLRPAGRSDVSTTSLMVYCAAVMRPPMEEIARAYQEATGVAIQLQYGGSGTLLSNLQISGAGDLYLAADASYIDLAREMDLVSDAARVAKLRPVLIVSEGNPRGIRGTEDLLRSDVRVSLANPDAASIGRVTRSIFTELGRWEGIEAAVRERGVFKPTVTDVANDVKLGAVDVGIVWDATARQYSELTALPLSEAAGVEESIMLAVLKTSRKPEAASAFIAYVGESEAAKRILTAHGFE